MFTISIETHFWASHSLSLPNGSKEPCHRHNWKVAVDVSSPTLDKMDMVMDFNRLKAMVDNIIAEIADKPLEKNDYFNRNNSSAEMVAKYVHQKLEKKIPKGVKLDSVSVTEQPGCTAKFGK